MNLPLGQVLLGGQLEPSCFGEELLGVGEGLFGGVSGEEASNLGNAVGGLDADEARLGDVGRIVATHHVVDGALHGHLGQMRDNDHLMGARQVCEHLREGAGRGAADASVDLVEHERVDGVRRRGPPWKRA